MDVAHTKLWKRGGLSAAPKLRHAVLRAGEVPLLLIARGVPARAVCALWAADPSSKTTLDASYHIRGPIERMPDPASFENMTIVQADEEGRLKAVLEHPLHGYSSRQEHYDEPPHVHMRWWYDGVAAPTFSYALSCGHGSKMA